MIINRTFAQPNKATFTQPPAREFVSRWLAGRKIIVDPFARKERLGTFTNDIDPKAKAQFNMEARDFLRKLVADGIKADAIIFDPPYSPTQIARSYRNAGRKVTQTDTQSAKLKKECRQLFRELAAPDCIVLSFGWNTVGMGEGWTTEEILLISHGGDHNDTICQAIINRQPSKVSK